MERLPMIAIILGIAVLAVSPPAAAGTDEADFNKRVAKLATPHPAILSVDVIQLALKKGKAMCVCPSTEFFGRAGVLVSEAEAQAAPLIICLVPIFSGDGAVSPSYASCGNWQPLTR